jgi:hypothetical protein
LGKFVGCLIVCLVLGGGCVFLAVLSHLSGDSHSVRKQVAPDVGPPRFGPGSFNGAIDDVNTRSPLRPRPSAKVEAEPTK